MIIYPKVLAFILISLSFIIYYFLFYYYFPTTFILLPKLNNNVKKDLVNENSEIILPDDYYEVMGKYEYLSKSISEKNNEKKNLSEELEKLNTIISIYDDNIKDLENKLYSIQNFFDNYKEKTSEDTLTSKFNTTAYIESLYFSYTMVNVFEDILLRNLLIDQINGLKFLYSMLTIFIKMDNLKMKPIFKNHLS